MKNKIKNSIPLVVLAGRVNVGKSTLFNRIAKTVRSLAFDQEGVTRDYLKDTVSWHGAAFTMVDTGGLDLKKSTDPIAQHVQQRVRQLVEQADVVVFVADASIGVTSYELELAKMLHRMGKSVIIAANKADIKVSLEHFEEFKRLGATAICPVSAEHNTGINELLDNIVALIPQVKIDKNEPEQTCRVTLLGKPNVGKSSLMNILVKEERSIVTDVPGTTREAITEPIRFYTQTIELTDTPGVRRSKTIKEDLEELMVKSSLSSVRTSDIVVLVVDAQEGRLTDQELKLAFYAFKEGKALIIAINKSDLLEPALEDSWRYHKEEYDFFYKKIEMITISCTTKERVGKLLPLIDTVWKRYITTFDNHDITHLVKQALLHKPLYRKEQRIVVKGIKQTKQGPPTFTLAVNNPKFIEEREYAFFEGVMRKEYKLKSVPIVFKLIDK